MIKAMDRAANSRLMNPDFQRTLLFINYGLLALSMVLYLLGVFGTWGIMVACVPGIIQFFVSVEVWAWKRTMDGDDPMTALLSQLIR